MTSSPERKKSSEIRRRENARWWMRNLLEAADLFVFAPAMRPCAEPYGFLYREKEREKRERASKRVRKCFGKEENSSESEQFSLEIFRIDLKRAGELSEQADDSPIVLPTFHRMRVHPKKPISCSLNLGSLMGVWEMGHQDGEKSSSRMLWVHKKIHNFPILAASTSFSFSSCSPLVALNGPGVGLWRDLSQRWWRCVCLNLLCSMPFVAPTAGRHPALRSCRFRIGEWSASAHVV